MPLELIKEVNGVPQVDLLIKLHTVYFRSLQPDCDYSKKYINGKFSLISSLTYGENKNAVLKIGWQEQEKSSSEMVTSMYYFLEN